MSWLAQLTASTPYLTGVALPMVLIGVGQGLAFAPLTAAGLAQVASRDAGAASGLVNTTHQLGSTLGVAVLVSLSAGAGSTLADRVTAAYTGGAVMLATALVAVLVLILPPELANRRAAGRDHAQTPVALAPR
jgi:sugar phosphate permease